MIRPRHSSSAAPRSVARSLARTSLTLASALALTLPLAAASSAAPSHEPVPVQLLSITDFHGQLQPTGEIRDSHGELIPAGGAAYLAAHLERLRHDRNSVFFATGDNYSSFEEEVERHDDEPAIEVLNDIGLDFSTIGNHEMDASPDFAVDHMEKGKCYGEIGVDSCFTDSSGERFAGADFDQYSANIVTKDTQKQVFPGIRVESFSSPSGGPSVKVGVINMVAPVLDELRNAGGHNLSYYPELMTLPIAETANAYAAELHRKGVDAIVLNVHAGAIHRKGGYDECIDPTGELIDLNAQLSPEIDVILGGHTHHALNCMLEDLDGDPRPVVQAGFHGRVISEITLQIDPTADEVVRDRTTSVNHPVTRDIAPDPQVAQTARYWADTLPETNAMPVARVAGDITTERDDSGESALGNLIADSLLAGTRDQESPEADLAVARTNGPDDHYGSDLIPAEDGQVTFGQVWDSMGARDPLLSVQVHGTQIDAMLEAQWQQEADGSVSFSPLAVSGNVHYSADPTKPVGERVDDASITIDGTPVRTDRQYRVVALPPTIFSTASRFSAPLDGFTSPARYTQKANEAFRWYLRDTSVVEVPSLDRVSIHDSGRP